MNHVSKLSLELTLLGAADEETRVHVEGCPRCRGLLDAMRTEDAAFLAAPDLPALARAASARRRRAWLRPAATALALAASVLFAFWWRPRAPVERMKGGSHVELFVRRGEETVRFEAQPLLAGDTLVFRYATAKRWLLVLDAEASGRTTAIIARPDGTSIPIEPGERVAPEGVRLDDYPGPERVIALLSDAPLSAAPLVEELARRVADLPGGALELGRLEVPGADEASWLLTKERR